MVIFIFIFWIIWIKNTLFGLIWSRNVKLSVQAEIWYLDYFEYAKFRCWYLFFCFRPFSASFVQKSIWNFNVTWLISQNVNRRDLKPVAFLVSIKSWKTSKPAIAVSGTCSSFWFPWLSALVCYSKVIFQTIICS